MKDAFPSEVDNHPARDRESLDTMSVWDKIPP